MLTVLLEVEARLPALLADPAGWRSKRIDYHPPLVERLYRETGGYRVNLHRVHPCAPDEALFHPHPWPSAMRLVAGRYRMKVGYGAGRQPPPDAMLVELAPGSAYAMTDRDAWHAVLPVDGPTLSVMVTGVPWGRAAPVVPDRALGPLSDGVAAELIAAFAAAYPGTPSP